MIVFSADATPRKDRGGAIGIARGPTLVDANRTRIRRTHANNRFGLLRQNLRRQNLRRYSALHSTTDKALRGYFEAVQTSSGLLSHSLLGRQLAIHGIRRAIAPAGPPTANTLVRREKSGTSNPPAELAKATSHEEVTSLLRSADLGALAQELDDLQDSAANDPELPAIDIGSLKTFAEFMLTRPQLATASIGVNEEGLVDAQWFLSPTIESDDDVAPKESRFWGDGRGMLVMIFLSNGMARFAANSGPAVGGKIRLRKNATCSLEMIPNELASYWHRLITQ